MKIIFLDVDGVLNSEKEIRDWTQSHPEEPCPYLFGILQSKVELLKKITDATGAGIVLSSSWRLVDTSKNKVIKMCKENKIEYLGETPDEVKLKKFEAVKCYRKQPPYLFDKASCPGYTHDRGAQISRWISQQKFTGEYIVLDDETQDILPWIPEEHVVQTTLWEGLTENKVEESIKKLLN